MFHPAGIVLRAAHVGFDELAWLASACSISVEEFMMAPSPRATEGEVVTATEDEFGHFTSLSIKNHMIIMYV